MNKLYNANSLDIFYKIINENHDKNIILVSDPPFNINYKYNTYNDNMDEDKYYEIRAERPRCLRKYLAAWHNHQESLTEGA